MFPKDRTLHVRTSVESRNNTTLCSDDFGGLGFLEIRRFDWLVEFFFFYWGR